MQEIIEKERCFSVELKSKLDLKNFNFTCNDNDEVILEGNLGELIKASFAEGVILEITGKKGIIRVDLEQKEISKTVQQNIPEVSSSE